MRGSLIGGCGDVDSCLMLRRWFADGADPERWPACQKDVGRFATLLVIDPTGAIHCYEREPIPFVVQDERHAVGSGMQYALAAMAMGADAIRAVEIACRLTTDCGMGIDSLRLGD